VKILGLSAHLHGSAAALLVDGEIVAASQEERFTRARYDNGFPTRAIRWCLREGGLSSTELDRVVFHEKPLRRFERVLASQLRAFPSSSRSFARSMFSWLGDRLWIRGRIADELGIPSDKVLFVEHALAHAAATFLGSPHERADVLVVDDEGEWATTTLLAGDGGELTTLEEQKLPHSLGLVVSTFAQYLGFEPSRGGEGRLTDLASYGTPRFLDEIARLTGADDQGGLEVDTEAFRYTFDGERLYGDPLVEALGAPRPSGEPLAFDGGDTRHADIAASVQELVERQLLALARRLHQRAGADVLCLGGEVAQNARAVGRLLRDGPYAAVHVPGSPGDEGTALGAALLAHHALADGPHHPPRTDCLGEEVVADPDAAGTELSGHEEVSAELTAALEAGGIVGWMRGRSEFGGRSLGHRSVLCDPRDPALVERVTRATKPREPFRTFHPAVTAEQAALLYELPAGGMQPAGVHRIAVPAKDEAKRLAPALVAADGLARPLVVHGDVDPLFHRVLTRWQEVSGCPLLLHTSLNGRGDPLLRTEAEAVALAQRAGLDTLVVDQRLHRSQEQQPVAS
jgi:carbamoyltransferase